MSKKKRNRNKGKEKLSPTPTSMPAKREPRPAHPAAEGFPLLQGNAWKTFVADIRANGYAGPDQAHKGKTLDGRNRDLACSIAGVEPRYVEIVTDDPAGYVNSANAHRRHLTTAQKRHGIMHALLTDPSKSNKSIAAAAGATDMTVGLMRKKLEAAGKIPVVGARVGADNKVRQQPEQKEPAEPQKEPEAQGEPEDNRKNLAVAEGDVDAPAGAIEPDGKPDPWPALSRKPSPEAMDDEDDDAEAIEADEADEAEPSAVEREAALNAKLSADELAALNLVSSAQLMEVMAPELSLDERATIEAMRVRRLLGRAFADSEIERLRASKHELERKCLALESQVEELKEENAKLKSALAAATRGEVMQ